MNLNRKLSSSDLAHPNKIKEVVCPSIRPSSVTNFTKLKILITQAFFMEKSSPRWQMKGFAIY